MIPDPFSTPRPSNHRCRKHLSPYPYSCQQVRIRVFANTILLPHPATESYAHAIYHGGAMKKQTLASTSSQQLATGLRCNANCLIEQKPPAKGRTAFSFYILQALNQALYTLRRMLIIATPAAMIAMTSATIGNAVPPVASSPSAPARPVAPVAPAGP